MADRPPGIDVEAARAATPGCAHVTHLNHAGASLMPQPVLDAVIGHLELEARIGGYEAYDQEAARIEGTYTSIAQLIGCRADEVALLDSATRAWDLAFRSVPLAAGDRILTGRSEYASNTMTMSQVAARTGVEVEVVPDDEHGQLDLPALDRALERPGVRLVALTHVPTSGGLVNPAEEVGRRCRAAGVMYLLDACQSVGQLSVDVDAVGCDLMTATGRKFLRAPRGTGFLYVRSEVLDRVDPPFVDLRSAEPTAPLAYEVRTDARRFESWESNVAGRLGLGAAVQHALGWGIDAIESRVTALAAGLRARLGAVPGVALHDLGERHCGIVTFSVAGTPPADVVACLRAGGVNINVSQGSLSQLDLVPRGLGAGVARASVHYVTTDDELDLATRLVADLAAA